MQDPGVNYSAKVFSGFPRRIKGKCRSSSLESTSKISYPYNDFNFPNSKSGLLFFFFCLMRLCCQWPCCGMMKRVAAPGPDLQHYFLTRTNKSSPPQLLEMANPCMGDRLEVPLIGFSTEGGLRLLGGRGPGRGRRLPWLLVEQHVHTDLRFTYLDN